MDLITLPPPPTAPLAQKAAQNIVAHVSPEMERRIKYHIARYNEFWCDYNVTPDEVLAELNALGVAALVITSRNQDLTAMGQLAALFSKQLSDLMPVEYLTLPRQFIANADGTLSLSEIPEGFDAWGRALPSPEPDPEA